MRRSSTNDKKNPYAKFNFFGSSACASTWDEIRKQSNKKTKPLMNDQEWKAFCKKRRNEIRPIK